jgi:hypothetical protein
VASGRYQINKGSNDHRGTDHMFPGNLMSLKLKESDCFSKLAHIVTHHQTPTRNSVPVIPTTYSP